MTGFDAEQDFNNQIKILLDRKENGQDLVQTALAKAAALEYERNSVKEGIKTELSEKYNSMISALDRMKKNEMDYEEYVFWAKELGLLKDRSYLNK